MTIETDAVLKDAVHEVQEAKKLIFGEKLDSNTLPGRVLVIIVSFLLLVWSIDKYGRR